MELSAFERRTWLVDHARETGRLVLAPRDPGFAEVRDITTIVTDRSVGDGVLRRLRALGVEAVVV